MKKGQAFNIRIEKIANTGEGIGFYDNRTVFVPYAFPGEMVTVIIERIQKKGPVWGKIEKIVEPHPQRIMGTEVIPFPGCDWQNIPLEVQHSLKKQILVEALSFFGKLAPEKLPFSEFVCSNKEWEYRNKITLSFSRQGLGFFEQNSHTLTQNFNSPLIPKEIIELIGKLNTYFIDKKIPFYMPETDTGDLRQIILKWNQNLEVLIGLVTRHKTLPKKEALINELPCFSNIQYSIVGIVQNINKTPKENKTGSKSKTLYGAPYITEEINGLIYAHSTTSFFQTNTDIAEKMLARLATWLTPNKSDVLFDIYGGVGFLSLPFAKYSGQVFIAESNMEAIEMALMNCSVNEISNVERFQGTAESFLEENKLFPSIVFLDPPRKGCSKMVMAKTIDRAPKQIVYTSCFPVSLARDLKMLTENNNYVIKEIVLFDMFPQTPHLETMVLLEKQN